jgi:hypothetical protein
MTTTTVSPLLNTTAVHQIAGLNGLIRTITNRPEVAQLLEGMFRNMVVPLGAVKDPGSALSLLLDAFGGNGAALERADTPDMEGVSATFPGGRVSLWFFMPRDEAADEDPVKADPEPSADNSEAAAESAPEVSA